MNKKIIRGILLVGIIAVIAAGLITGRTVYAADGERTDYAPQNVRAVRHSNTAIRVRWKSDESVDGYIIYRYNRSSRKYKKVKVVKDAAADRWVDRHLKTNTVYRYKVASYKLVDGKKQVSNRSDWVSAKTYKRTTQYINAQAPKVNTQKVYLGLRSTTKIKSKVIASKYGRNRKKKPFSTKVRWYSSDTAVATVDKNGVVTAGIQPGKCSVYAMAHNGAKTRVEVVVKNYAKEDDFYNYGQEDDIYTLITDFKPQIQNIAEYYSINRIGEDEVIYIDLDDDANVIITPANADIGNLKEDIEKLLVDFPYYIRIEVTCDSVEYILKKEDTKGALSAHVTFFFDNDCSQWSGQIADHWEAYRHYPD
ncbi:MAG: Ig-like domain-containing protein [Clostridium sp.]|nr:Ig-like domain-containing protein [Clostridium sp.]